MYMLNRILKKIYHLIDRITHHLPETIQINPKRRKILSNILYYGALVNAIVFMFLYVTLFYGYDVFGLKQFFK